MGDTEWSHQNKEWQETLDLARNYGWTSVRQSNHGVLLIKCPSGDHSKKVFSTGRGTENVARSTRIYIRGCQHRNLTDVIHRVEDALDNAERLLTGASALLDRSDAHEAMQDLLGLAEEHLAQVEDEFDNESKKYDTAGVQAGHLLGIEARNSNPKLLIDQAGYPLRAAKLELRDLPVRNDEVATLKSRLESLKQLHDGLKVRSIQSTVRQLPENS